MDVTELKEWNAASQDGIAITSARSCESMISGKGRNSIMKTAKSTTIRTTTIVIIKAASAIMTTNSETTITTTADASYDHCIIIHFKVINLHIAEHKIDHRARRVHDMLSESNMEDNSDKALKPDYASICLEKLKSDHTSI
eukprot:12411745-Karenia_brevis.AAC.1